MRHAASHARASGLHIARLRCGSLGKDQAHAGRAAEGREGGREGGRERERERERKMNRVAAAWPSACIARELPKEPLALAR